MRSVFTRYSKDRLRIVGRRTYKIAHHLGCRPVVNSDDVRDVLLADKMECDGRTTSIHVVTPKRCQAVRVIVSGVPVITNAQQPTLQKPDDGGGDDAYAEWILAVSSDVAGNLKT